MTHDPMFFHHDDLCPEIIDPGSPERCQCALIAAVREDERKYGMVPGFDLGYAAALRDAKAAIMQVPRGGWGLKVHEHYRNCIAAIEAIGGER